MIHRLILSCDTFGGFSIEYAPVPADSLNTLVTRILQQLDETLARHQFHMLRDILRSYQRQHQYHIHTHSIEEIFNATQPLQIFVCRCDGNVH